MREARNRSNCGGTWGRPMSSSRRQSADMMMMMMDYRWTCSASPCAARAAGTLRACSLRASVNRHDHTQLLLLESSRTYETIDRLTFLRVNELVLLRHAVRIRQVHFTLALCVLAC